MIIRICVHYTPTACQTTLVIKSRWRLIYALAVNRHESVRLSIRCSVIHSPFISDDRGQLSELAGTAGRGHHLLARPGRKSPQVRNDHSTVPSWKRNDYTRRCNYCGWLRLVAVNNERAMRHHAQHLSPGEGNVTCGSLAVILLIYQATFSPRNYIIPNA